MKNPVQFCPFCLRAYSKSASDASAPQATDQKINDRNILKKDNPKSKYEEALSNYNLEIDDAFVEEEVKKIITLHQEYIRRTRNQSPDRCAGQILQPGNGKVS